MTYAPFPQRCPECSAALPPGAPPALCPACLLRQALVSRTAFDPDAPAASALPPPSPAEIADKFPQFEITECLGRGGMGVVYRARQKSLDRWVALKILAPERIGQEKFAERFAREAQILARLNHPNIVTVYDHGQTGGLFYIVMEFVDGVNLRDLLRDGKLEPKQALAIVPPICEALQYAHNKGVVHRDTKPENLLLDREGRIKVADFGIAALVGAASGERGGTPPYMAPEQADTGAMVDHRADIYALGVVLYELLTGHRPEPGRLSSASAGMAPELTVLVNRALEKEPARRFPTASDLGHAATALASGTPARPQRRMRRPALLAFAGVLVATAIWLFLAGRSRDPRELVWDRPLVRNSPHKSDGRFVAHLPDGATIELLAVRLCPNENTAWWRPDGAPSDFDPAIEADRQRWPGLCMEAIARLSPPPNPSAPGASAEELASGYRYTSPTRSQARLRDRLVPQTEYVILTFSNPPSLGDETRLLITVTTTKWQTLVAQKPGWFSALPFMLRGQAWTFSDWAGGALQVTLPTPRQFQDYEYELAAYDRSGREYTLAPHSGERSGTHDTTTYQSRATVGASGQHVDGAWQYQAVAIPALRREDTAEVHWRARLQDTIEFNRVSLRPGVITRVTVIDYPTPAVGSSGAESTATPKPAP